MPKTNRVSESTSVVPATNCSRAARTSAADRELGNNALPPNIGDVGKAFERNVMLTSW